MHSLSLILSIIVLQGKAVAAAFIHMRALVQDAGRVEARLSALVTRLRDSVTVTRYLISLDPGDPPAAGPSTEQHRLPLLVKQHPDTSYLVFLVCGKFTTVRGEGP